ncbi:hypothetical protein ACEWY4_002850 [Coilia grayii]|uniref:DUF4485 domain-containing protein n=1 Tax=Coilia grayii TaxID=363190 RepID=A0ABD1KPN8_9TELE
MTTGRVAENGNDASLLSGKQPKFEPFCDCKQEVTQLLVNEIVVFFQHTDLFLIICSHRLHASMSKQEDTLEKLDSEFDHYLVDMKPYVLKLASRSERQRCALWIKKLCDPVACGSGLTGRKNRNMYARLLLHMLKGGVLEGPFTQKPDGGSLKTLPTYLSIYFDEPLFGRTQEERPAAVPDWVSGELGPSDDTWSSLLKDSSPVAHHSTHRRMLGYDKSPSRPMASSPLKPAGRENNNTVNGLCQASLSADDSDLEARLNSWNLGIENPRYLREKPIPVSPSAEMRAKVLEAKHQEEKLQLQQKHDAHVQKAFGAGMSIFAQVPVPPFTPPPPQEGFEQHWALTAGSEGGRRFENVGRLRGPKRGSLEKAPAQDPTPPHPMAAASALPPPLPSAAPSAPT